jgi:UrcA family protein
MNSIVKTANRTIIAYSTAVWLACVLVASNAYADDVRSETVKFAELDVNKPAGVEALYSRIHAAALRVCAQPAGEAAAIRSCVTKAESEAIGKLSLPLLTAFYEKKTGSRPQAFTAKR